MYSTTTVHSLNGRAFYEVWDYREGFGEFPIFGSGPSAHVSRDEELAYHKRRRVDLLTFEEYENHLRRWFPTTWEYREELRGASLDSAAL